MFEIGFGELILVAIITCWAIGPEKLPSVMRVCGRYLFRAKKAMSNIKREFQDEFNRSIPPE